MMYNVAAPKIFELDFSKSKICMDYTPESRGQIQRAESWIKKIAMAVPVVVLASAALRVDNIEQISTELLASKTMIGAVASVAILGALYLTARRTLNRIDHVEKQVQKESRTKGELTEIFQSVKKSFIDEIGRTHFRDLDNERIDKKKYPDSRAGVIDFINEIGSRASSSLTRCTETMDALGKLWGMLEQLLNRFANAEQSQSIYLGKELTGEIDKFQVFLKKIEPRLKESDDVRNAVIRLLKGQESIKEISTDLKFSVEELNSWKEFIKEERGLCKFEELDVKALNQKLWEISYSIINDRKVKFLEATFEENKAK